VWWPGSLSISEKLQTGADARLSTLEGFNIFNHGNFLARGVTTYGDLATPATTFGLFTPAKAIGADRHAIPAFANIDPPRMFQLQARFIF
jgi:hypothetical protein